MDFIVIVAGGKGLRMGGEIPKQFLPVGGKPVLMRTLEQFEGIAQIILVLPKEQQGYWHELCEQYHFAVPHYVADGGATRFHSVQNGLALIPSDADGVVGVHDGVRPFVSKKTIARCFEVAREKEAAIPVMPVVETLRDIKQGVNVYRENYRIVQTPQTFRIGLLKKANEQPYQESFTDDASVVEAYWRQQGATGKSITMVEGNRENIKITTPFDLQLAGMLVS